MKRGDMRNIKLADGDTRPLLYLGRGRHCTAWRFGDSVYCFTDDDEYMKDVLCEFPICSVHVPVIQRLPDPPPVRGKDKKLYRMKYYRDVRARDNCWKIAKLLENSREWLYNTQFRFKRELRFDGHYLNQLVIEDTAGKVPQSVTDCLTDLANTAGMYGASITFEFGKRNLGVDLDGNLIFRDVLFDAEKLLVQKGHLKQ